MTQDVNGAIARYAQRFHATVGEEHHVASPLGAWLLLALCASASDSASRAALTDTLGMDAAAAAEVAITMLEQPHPLVPTATAIWHGPGVDTDSLRHWYSSLPTRVRSGPLPAQTLLDAWAREHSQGLIDAFPVNVTPDVMLVLAGVLATRVSWDDPFDVVPGSMLGPDSAWAVGLSRVLSSPSAGHVTFIAATEQAGDVIVHAARALSGTAGVSVVSVAASPNVPFGDVLAAAHEIVPTVHDQHPTLRVSLFDLPVGETALWRIREGQEPTFAPGGREERHRAVLPCWAASDEHDLSDPSLGFPLAAQLLAPLLDSTGLAFEARQAAMARYGRYGFEAAAVTGFATSDSEPMVGVVRTADLRFGHPYAVVAVATDVRFDADGGQVRGPWHGIPVFSGWVSRPESVPDDEIT
ncbi:hypothetical protein [Actinoplanes xinjiangensis]|uniref:hypothetical protein n=1 Tax=Actinoplanes xinjiangensis TaxID=512350 RepID=UPI00341F0BF6